MNTVKINEVTFEIKEEVSDLIFNISIERDQLRADLAQSREEVERLQEDIVVEKKQALIDKDMIRTNRDRTKARAKELEVIAHNWRITAQKITDHWGKAEADSNRYREGLEKIKDMIEFECDDYYHGSCDCQVDESNACRDIAEHALKVDTEDSKG